MRYYLKATRNNKTVWLYTLHENGEPALVTGRKERAYCFDSKTGRDIEQKAKSAERAFGVPFVCEPDCRPLSESEFESYMNAAFQVTVNSFYKRLLETLADNAAAVMAVTMASRYAMENLPAARNVDVVRDFRELFGDALCREIQRAESSQKKRAS